jgi:hypothetical protein
VQALQLAPREQEPIVTVYPLHQAAEDRLHVIDITIPGMRLVSEANSHTHWRARQQRAKQQRMTACWHVISKRLSAAQRLRPVAWMRGPVRVTITRIAPRSLDSDNLVGSAKHVRDGVADALGINDRDERVQWVVAQAKCASGYSVRIQIEALAQVLEPTSRPQGTATRSG